MTSRWIKEPSDPAAPDRHRCEPIGEPVYGDGVIGSHLDRWNAHPCIGWEQAATTSDLPLLESVLRLTPVETGADIYLWLLTLRETEPVRSRPAFEGHRRFLDALLSDIVAHPKVAAVLNDWEAETAERRDRRLRRALAALREDAERAGTTVDLPADRPLPDPEGTM